MSFGQLILAAPDIQVALFRDLAKLYPLVSKRTTMYVSSRDEGLGMSKWLQDSDRAGFTPPVTVVPNIDTVAVSKIDLSVLGHAYYGEAEGVLYDIAEVLKHYSPPGKRTRNPWFRAYTQVDGPDFADNVFSIWITNPGKTTPSSRESTLDHYGHAVESHTCSHFK